MNMKVMLRFRLWIRSNGVALLDRSQKAPACVWLACDIDDQAGNI
jgi:hypothetical protein